jgi:hypothetical protein
VTWLSDLEAGAREALPRPVFDYLAQGARDSVSSLEASSGWTERRFLPHVLHRIASGQDGAGCGQHQGGFSGSTTGRAHFGRLNVGFDSGRQYEIYARRSEFGEVLGEIQIPMVCAEELAFIKKFRPPWNRGA